MFCCRWQLGLQAEVGLWVCVTDHAMAGAALALRSGIQGSVSLRLHGLSLGAALPLQAFLYGWTCVRAIAWMGCGSQGDSHESFQLRAVLLAHVG